MMYVWPIRLQASVAWFSWIVLICWSLSSISLTEVQVRGTWDGHFSGTVKGKGTSQTDTFVMELHQVGSNVDGTIRFRGLDLSFPLSGIVEGDVFRYTAKARLGPKCDAIVTGETAVDSRAGRLTGTQTQANCEGTAIGQMTAVRR